jgi:hypothetical protein
VARLARADLKGGLNIKTLFLLEEQNGTLLFFAPEE